MIRMKSSLVERQSLRKRMGHEGEKWLHMKFRGTLKHKCQAKEERDPKGFEKKRNRRRKGSCVHKVQGRGDSAVLNAAKARRTNPSNLATSRSHAQWQSLQLLTTGPDYLQTESQRWAHFSHCQERKGTSLVIQWLRLHLPMQGSSGFIPGWGS